MWYLVSKEEDTLLTAAARAYGETLLTQAELPDAAEVLFLKRKDLLRPPYPCVCIAMDASEPIEVCGWDFAVREPFDREMLIRIAATLCGRKAPLVRDTLVETCLAALSVPSHLLGYRYILSAIEWIRMQPKPMQVSMLHDIYPMVAEQYGSSPIMVNRAIRHAIESAWKHGALEIQRSYFGYASQDKKGVPTNIEFLFAVYERLRLLLDDPNR